MEKTEYMQRSLLWNAFCAFDHDGSGSISMEEMLDVMCTYEEHHRENFVEELKEHIHMHDTNRDGCIDFEERGNFALAGQNFAGVLLNEFVKKEDARAKVLGEPILRIRDVHCEACPELLVVVEGLHKAREFHRTGLCGRFDAVADLGDEPVFRVAVGAGRGDGVCVGAMGQGLCGHDGTF